MESKQVPEKHANAQVIQPSQPDHCAIVIPCTSEFGQDEARAQNTT